MAEAGLSLGLPDFRTAVLIFLGLNRTFASASANEQTDVDAIIQSGVRQFYYPPQIDFQGRPGYQHRWSFLYPTTTVATVADDFDTTLPDDFGGIIGDFYYAANQGFGPCRVVNPNTVNYERQFTNSTGRPRIAGIRPRSSTGSTGQRFEVLFFPTPDSAYTLTYRYQALLGTLTASLPYPVGGSQHSETVLESCLAVAEHRMDDERGLHYELFMERLRASIEQDLAQQPRYLGYNGDNSAQQWEPELVRGIKVNGTLQS